jgi:hypothetical protein
VGSHALSDDSSVNFTKKPVATPKRVKFREFQVQRVPSSESSKFREFKFYI